VDLIGNFGPDDPKEIETDLIWQIADRALVLAKKHKIKYDRMTCELDLEAAHAQFPLDLVRLLSADDGNFGHDVFGIRRYINRETAELENLFVPRCCLRQKELV
jgi:hypothetical protein